MATRELLLLVAGCVLLSVEGFSPLHLQLPVRTGRLSQAAATSSTGRLQSLRCANVQASRNPLGVTMADAPAVRKDRSLRNTVLVTGATGRVGQLVVDEILTRFPSSKVRAVVRSEESMSKLSSKMEANPDRLESVVCDLNSRAEIRQALDGVNQVVWCASGLSPPRGSVLSKLLFVASFKVKAFFRRALDIRGPRIMCEELSAQPAPVDSTREEGTTTQTKSSESAAELPRFVMLSSAAVTRPGWSDEKKAQFPEAAEIPIVKLNPLGILGLKLKGEDGVRASGVPYTIIRSCGITANHTAGQAFQVATGDTSVGQIHPSDLGAALATLLGVPEASGKTVELRTEGSGGIFGRGTKSSMTQQMAKVAADAEQGSTAPSVAAAAEQKVEAGATK